MTLQLLLGRLPPSKLSLAATAYQDGRLTDAIADVAWEYLTENVPFPETLAQCRELREAFCRSLVRRLHRTGYRILNENAALYVGPEQHCGLAVLSLPELIQQYPALANIWNAQLKGWGSFVASFVEHLIIFQRRVGEPNALKTVETDLSDYHDGRSVTCVCFRRGGNWIYKPRSGEREAGWSQLLEALNRGGFSPPFLVPEVRTAQGCCWMRSIDSRACRTIGTFQRFRYRTGAILYLAHMFRAVDLHAGNFINHGEHPVLIDSETLFHPETRLPASLRTAERGFARTGMLGAVMGKNSNPFIKSTDISPDGPNSRKRFLGRDFDQVLRGFEAMHRFLRKHGTDPRIDEAIRQLRRTSTRYVYRPTLLYDRILDEALHPAQLRSICGPRRRLRSHLDNGLCEANIVRQEIRQLLKGDIPRFHGKAAPIRPHLTYRSFATTFDSLRECLEQSG